MVEKIILTDQIGGKEMKKFYTKNFKKLLLTTSSLSMLEQREAIETRFDEWVGDSAQIDDVTVVGLEV